MTSLTSAQHAVLAPACKRDDRCIFPVTASLTGGAVGNVARSLLKRGLVEEVPATDAHFVWRCGEDGAPLTLRATDLGRRAIISDDVDGSIGEETQLTPASNGEIAEVPPTRRNGTQQVLLELLRRADGTTIAEMQHATGWQAHSIRGAISGVIARKLGHKVVSDKDAVRGRIYRIVA